LSRELTNWETNSSTHI